MDMKIALKHFKRNAANSQYVFKHYSTYYCSYVRYSLSNVLLFNVVISLDYELPKDLHEMRFVGCNFLKTHYVSLIMKCVSFSADEVLFCNSFIHYDTLDC